MRTFVKCMAGMEEIWVARMNNALRVEGPYI
jgi:hypothetical protein